MKKMLKLLTALLLCMAMFGCSSSTEPSENVSEEKKVYKVGGVQLLQHDALDAASQGFTDALKDLLGDQVEITIQNASGDYNSSATIANQFVSENVDLIMANATPALQAVSAATATIPVVGVSISHYGTALSIDPWTGKTGTNVTGVSDLAPLDQQADQIVEIFPEARKVAILYCSSEANSEYQASVIEEELHKKNIETQRFTFSDTNDIAAVTGSACDYADVIYIPTDNTAATYTETINNVAIVAKTPIVAGEEGMAKGCGCVTITLSYYDIGYQAGQMAYEILVNGADPGEMEIQFAAEFTKKYNVDLCNFYEVNIPEDYSPIQ